MYRKDICEKERQERDCLVMDLDLVIGGRPDTRPGASGTP